MKKLLLLLLLIIPVQSAGQSLDSLNYHLNQAEYHIQQAREHAVAPEITVPNITVEYRGNGTFNVEWQPFRADTIDIYFQSPQVHGDRWLSVNEFVALHNNPPDPQAGEHPIQVNQEDKDSLENTWRFYLWSPQDSSQVVTLAAEPKPTAQLITLATNEKAGSTYFRDDFYAGNVLGFIEQNGTYRVYFQNRAIRDHEDHATVEMVESDDLLNWTEPVPTELGGAEWLVDVDGEIHCWIPEGNDGYIWTDFHVIEGCRERGHKALSDWRIDGTLGPNYFDGTYMQLGRVRGWGPNENGGWEDDFTDYPLPEWYPDMVEAYQGQAPWFNILEALHDRRGVSYHEGKKGQVWSNRIMLDPENVEMEGFLGWEYPDKKGIADFYSAMLVDPERILLKVYWKKNDRLIDRSMRGGEYEYMRPQRRFRFTGETTVIPARINNGEIEIVSLESVLPYETFARTAHPDVSWATCPDCIEVGQYTPSTNVIYKDGYAHIAFQYRDDVHYESANNVNGDGLIRHLTGIYLYRVPIEEFNSWWE